MGYKRRTASTYKLEFVFEVEMTVRGMVWAQMYRSKLSEYVEGFFTPIMLGYRFCRVDGYPSSTYCKLSMMTDVRPLEKSDMGKITAVTVKGACSGTVKAHFLPEGDLAKFLDVSPQVSPVRLSRGELYVSDCRLLSVSEPKIEFLGKSSFSMRWAKPSEKLESQVLSVLQSLSAKSNCSLFPRMDADVFVEEHARDIARRVWEMHNYNRNFGWAEESEIREAAGYILLNRP